MGEYRTRGLLMDGVGSFTFPKGTSFAEADDAFSLGDKALFEGWMYDPKRGWYRVEAPVIVFGTSCVGEEPYTLKLKMAGKPETLEG